MSWCEAHMVFEGEVGCLCDAELESGFVAYDPPDDGDPYGEDGRA